MGVKSSPPKKLEVKDPEGKCCSESESHSADEHIDQFRTGD